MSGYYFFEFCYLVVVYINFLIIKYFMDFYFKFLFNGFFDGILWVFLDIFFFGSVAIVSVEIDGKFYENFDVQGLIVILFDS